MLPVNPVSYFWKSPEDTLHGELNFQDRCWGFCSCFIKCVQQSCKEETECCAFVGREEGCLAPPCPKPCPLQSPSSNFHLSLFQGGILAIKEEVKVDACVKFFVFTRKFYIISKCSFSFLNILDHFYSLFFMLFIYLN